MSKKIKIFFLLFFPTIVFGQNFKLINSFQIDSIGKAYLNEEGFEFVILASTEKGVYSNFHIANIDGSEVRPASFEAAQPIQFSKNLRVPAMKNDKFGFVNRRGDLIIPIEYDYLGKEFIEGKVIGKKNEQWFFIDTLGNETPFPDSSNYMSLQIANPHTIIAMTNRREYSFLDFQGKVLFEERFTYVKPSRFHDYLFNVSKGKLSGILSSKNGIIFPLDRENIPSIKENFIVNEHRTRSDLNFWDLDGKPIDTKGKTISKSARAVGYIFREYRENKRYFGLCDKVFKTLFPAEFKKFYILAHGYLQLFYPNNHSIVINKSGEVVLRLDNYYRVYVLSPDDLVTEKTKRVNGRTERTITWLDGNGKTMLTPPIETTLGPSPIHGEKQYDRVQTILGAKRKDTTGVSKYHLYNRQAELLSVVDYDSVYYFTPSLLLVIKNKKQGLINEQGELALPIEYKRISPIYNEVKNDGSITNLLRLVKPDGKMGLADLEGNLVFLTTETVNQIHWVNEKYLWVIKGNEYRVYEWEK